MIKFEALKCGDRLDIARMGNCVARRVEVLEKTDWCVLIQNLDSKRRTTVTAKTWDADCGYCSRVRYMTVTSETLHATSEAASIRRELAKTAARLTEIEHGLSMIQATLSVVCTQLDLVPRRGDVAIDGAGAYRPANGVYTDGVHK